MVELLLSLPMYTLEDSNHHRTWWYEQLNLSTDWNVMTPEMRNDLTKKLQRALQDLTQLDITKEDMLELLILADQATVWDAILALQDLPDRKNRNRYELLAYLRKTVTGMWKDQHPSKQHNWQTEPANKSKRKIAPPVSWETVEKYNPLNFSKRFCNLCGSSIRSNNATGACYTCQRKGSSALEC